MIDEYKKLNIYLGSFQYTSIADWYTMMCRDEHHLPEEYLEILKNPKKKEKMFNKINKFLEVVYDNYMFILEQDVNAIKTSDRKFVKRFMDFCDDCYSSKEEEIYRKKEELSAEPFEFPVHPNLDKVAILKYSAFRRNEAWDLWTLLNHFRNEFDFPITKGEMIGLADSDRLEAGILFIIKKLYNLDDAMITKYFGNFDT